MNKVVKNLLFALSLVFISQSVLFAQDVTVIDGKDKNQDDIVTDLLINADNLLGKTIRIDNFTYEKFGTGSGNSGFLDGNPWFDDTMTFFFNQSNQMYSYYFKFCFHPDTTEGKRYCMNLVSKYYTYPQQISLEGRFVKYKLNTGQSLYYFLVTKLSILGNTYTGTIPSK